MEPTRRRARPDIEELAQWQLEFRLAGLLRKARKRIARRGAGIRRLGERGNDLRKRHLGGQQLVIGRDLEIEIHGELVDHGQQVDVGIDQGLRIHDRQRQRRTGQRAEDLVDQACIEAHEPAGDCHRRQLADRCRAGGSEPGRIAQDMRKEQLGRLADGDLERIGRGRIGDKTLVDGDAGIGAVAPLHHFGIATELVEGHGFIERNDAVGRQHLAAVTHRIGYAVALEMAEDRLFGMGDVGDADDRSKIRILLEIALGEQQIAVIDAEGCHHQHDRGHDGGEDIDAPRPRSKKRATNGTDALHQMPPSLMVEKCLIWLPGIAKE